MKPSDTPTVLAALRGHWQQIDHDEGKELNQTLVFTRGAEGLWKQDAGTPPISISYSVAGTELILRSFHPTFDHPQQLQFDFKLDGDSLALTRNGETTRVQRILEIENHVDVVEPWFGELEASQAPRM